MIKNHVVLNTIVAMFCTLAFIATIWLHVPEWELKVRYTSMVLVCCLIFVLLITTDLLPKITHLILIFFNFAKDLDRKTKTFIAASIFVITISFLLAKVQLEDRKVKFLEQYREEITRRLP